MRLEGIYQFLYVMPVSLAAMFLFLATISLIWILRDTYEGFGYNVAWSSQIGDVALIGCILVGMEVLQSEHRAPPLLAPASVQVGAVFAAIGFGMVWYKVDRPSEWGDMYHHTVVAPIFAVLLLLTVPVVFAFGSFWQCLAVAAMLGLWAALVVIDLGAGRMDQRRWLQKRGILES
jgi:hypothetical protein